MVLLLDLAGHFSGRTTASAQQTLSSSHHAPNRTSAVQEAGSHGCHKNPLGLKGVGRCQMIRWCNDRKRLEDDCSSEAAEKGAQE
jgi:hypothetical protein